MAMKRAVINIAIVAMIIEVAMATTYKVGGPNGGWDLNTNLQAWASANSFVVGDSLSFQYTSFHDVVEVIKADYDSCLISTPIATYTSGSTIIALSTPGKRFFICGTPGHCIQGMKVEIDTLAASSPPPTSTSSPPPPAASSPPPTSPSSPPPAAVSSPPPTASPISPATPKEGPSSTPTNSPKSAPSQSPSSLSGSPPASTPAAESPKVHAPAPETTHSLATRGFHANLAVATAAVMVIMLLI
ncbi:Phytocyanin domain [Dillenia turbinata]|uniref:Phytocyanin domain n=1 Tax=Dillenia turbinata TaxID=194707 RepID=A0AAN8YXL3_9MAGN